MAYASAYAYYLQNLFSSFPFNPPKIVETDFSLLFFVPNSVPATRRMNESAFRKKLVRTWKFLFGRWQDDERVAARKRIWKARMSFWVMVSIHIQIYVKAVDRPFGKRSCHLLNERYSSLRLLDLYLTKSVQSVHYFFTLLLILLLKYNFLQPKSLFFINDYPPNQNMM